MDQETLYNILTGAYGPLFDSIEMWACINALGIKPRRFNNKWCFSYSSDCGNLVIGFGDTIYEAACDFYKAICTTKTSNK